MIVRVNNKPKPRLMISRSNAAAIMPDAPEKNLYVRGDAGAVAEIIK